MRNRLGFLLVMLVCGLILTGVSQATQAQDAGICPQLVQQALEQMGDNCTSMDRNNACYGFNPVQSVFVDAVEPEFFTKPADRAALAEVQTITTGPMDLDEDEWGIAVMNVQANVPNSLPGQAVTFMLMGDVEVEDQVDPAAIPDPADPVNMITEAETRIFSGPSVNTSTVMIAPVDTIMTADVQSKDGDWVRVLSPEGLGWVRHEIFGDAAGINDLPVYSAEDQSPMQSFQVRTAFDDLLCDEAPSLLAIQSPEGMTVDLNANGAHIQLGSLVMLRTIAPGNTLQFIVIEGHGVLDPGTPFETEIPAGFLTQRCLDDGDWVYDDCGWLPPLPMTEQELAWAQTVLLAFEGFETPNIGSFAFGGDTFTLINTGSCATGATIEHTVQAGETLFQLGLAYNTTSDAIIFGNSLPDTQLAPGQVLEIICGDQGPSSLPSLGAPPEPAAPQFFPPQQQPPPPPPPPVDCSAFRATAPLNGLAYPTTTFYWDAAPGATGYRITIMGESGTFFFVTGGNTLSMTIDTSNSGIGFGFDFSWSVEALFNDQVICGSPLARMQREAPDPPPEPRQEPEPPSQETEEPCPNCPCTFCIGG